MNTPINSLLGPLEAATRQGSWEDVEDIAREISRLARFQRLQELQEIREALNTAYGRRHTSAYIEGLKTSPGGSQGAKTPLPVDSFTPIPFAPIHQEKNQVDAMWILEKLKDPAWVAKAKVSGWGVEELKKRATEALPMSLEDRFDETGHPEPWRNELAKELNLALDVACWLDWWGDTMKASKAIQSVVTRVAELEEIRLIQPPWTDEQKQALASVLDTIQP